MSPRRDVTVTTINGRRVDSHKAKISVFDNALLYAEGIFETFLAVDEKIVFLEAHLDRLYRSAKVLDLKLPVDRETLTGWMQKTVKAHRSRVKKLRLTISSGEAAKWVGFQGKPQVILSAAPHTMPTEPFRLLVSDLKVDHESVLRRVKTISYAIHAAALKRAKARRFDDALMLNRRNEVAEVTTANIFWVKSGRMYSPPLSAGCLDGVTRRMAFKVMKRAGMRVTEKTVSLDVLADADEVFISSSLKLIVPVSQIRDGRRVLRFKSGPVTERAAGLLRELALGEL